MSAYSEDKRVWLAGGILAAVLLVAIGWLGVISPALSSTKSLKSQADDATFQNIGLQSKASQLRHENDNVGTLTASLRKALTELPSDSGLPAYTRQLSAQAAANHVTLKTITVSPSSAVGGSTTSTGTASSPAGTGSALVSIPITLTSTGTARNLTAFLKAIQVTGPRRALVTSTQMTATLGASVNTGATMTTQLNVFSAPLTAAAQAQLETLLNGTK